MPVAAGPLQPVCRRLSAGGASEILHRTEQEAARAHPAGQGLQQRPQVPEVDEYVRGHDQVVRPDGLRQVFQDVRTAQLVVTPALPRPGEHVGRQIHPGEAPAPGPKHGAGLAGATADVQALFQGRGASGPPGRGQCGQILRHGVSQPLCQVLVEVAGVSVEQLLDIRRRGPICPCTAQGGGQMAGGFVFRLQAQQPLQAVEGLAPRAPRRVQAGQVVEHPWVRGGVFQGLPETAPGQIPLAEGTRHHTQVVEGLDVPGRQLQGLFQAGDRLFPLPEALAVSRDEVAANFARALEKGLLKIMSKMGISTVDSYCGAQIFEAIGLGQDVIDLCLRGTPSRLGGVSLNRLAQDVLSLHRDAFGADGPRLPSPGLFKYKRGGEYHAFNPEVVKTLHKAIETGDSALYRRFARLTRDGAATPRDGLSFRSDRQPIPLEAVEPVAEIVRRFSTAAISHGAIGSEAHRTLAIAMNRLGAMSNSGEGGEAVERYGTESNSAIKQVASGRFGVTPAYLMSAREIQIKMAQGSKPGEGGHLPGHKVTAEIAALRHSTPGVGLISPPPHHDIYSIEDLAQLIYDLKQINPHAAVSVKLVAETGVGTIAAGVVKGGADVVHISGADGGTGASPLSSIRHAGLPFELGLAEAQQTLIANDLRDRVRLRVDGGLKTGRDVVIAALLGADEYSFGTAALIAEGCLMARACHRNSCPVGIATQRPELRARFPGTPEMVMAYMTFIAQEVREILAELGYPTLSELIGRADLLAQNGLSPLDLSPLLATPDRKGILPRRNILPANDIHTVSYLNWHLLEAARPALDAGQVVTQHLKIRNTDRGVGATLSGAIAARFGPAGLPEGTIHVVFEGSAGQSFGLFNSPGLHLTVIGEANDYVGKGMAGGEIILIPSPETPFRSHENVILGNTALYGATGGRLFAAGRAGERFAVRNSGAEAVVEGVGHHGCEYMTGGVVVVLGEVGFNFGAGMSGGIAFVYDPAGALPLKLNPDMVHALPVAAPADATRLRRLVEAHARKTGSEHAWRLLADWESALAAFRKVEPIEKPGAVKGWSVKRETWNVKRGA